MTYSYLTKILILILLAVGLQSCVQKELERKIETDVANENTTKNLTDLRGETKILIENDPSLTAEQKRQLKVLRDSTREKNDKMWDQSLRLRAVLIKSLLAENYNEQETNMIKNKLRIIEEKRLDELFAAVESANKILGHQAVSHRWMAHELFNHSGNMDQ